MLESTSSAALDEFDVLSCMYSDSLSLHPPNSSRLESLDFFYDTPYQISIGPEADAVLVIFSFPRGYPHSCPAKIDISARPRLLRLLGDEWRQHWMDIYDSEHDEQPFSSFLLWLSSFVDTRLSLEENSGIAIEYPSSPLRSSDCSSPNGQNSEEKEPLSHLEEQLVDMSILQQQRYLPPIDIWESDIIVDRKSKFIAHAARVESPSQAMSVRDQLLSSKKYASATHNIWVYRIRQPDGIIHEASDDDGESGASLKLLYFLQTSNVENIVVIVTRWYGGVQLGPDRFKHILSVAVQVLQHHNVLPSPHSEKEKTHSSGAKSKGK